MTMEAGCTGNTDCRKNAICKTVMYNTECECESGFYDFPPFTTAENQGCLGECNDVGETDQCKGNTQCELTTQGYGKCVCPAETFGPPECLDDCESNVQCSYRGDCQNGECVCFPGYEGKYCEVIETTTTTTERPGINLALLLGASVLPLLLLVPAGLVSALTSG
ncbi:slit homolog 1 protein-like [Crassostrea angulata]|uniref:slit homolog 1 protein-like n=1 Tax=Magallana angulata TaxID=2784310 RepID=UPI00148A47E9|nr:slit homolog 1 protein isoform X2 [Crassostrea gigas]XP_052711394.1 slit homolog 1 protein-like [Crassostrea angulata]